MAASCVARPRLEAIDGLRGLCAIMIVILHLPAHGPLLGAPFVRSFYLFVDFFFVLSGFVIGRGYAARLAGGLPLRRFLWARVTTLYPLYLLMLGGFVALNLIESALDLRGAGRGAFTFPDDPVRLAISAVMLQSFFGGAALIWNVPGWSVAVEMMIYLLCGGLMRFTGRALPLAMLVVLAASLAVLLSPDVATIAQFGPRALARCGYGFAVGYHAYRAEPYVVGRVQRLARWQATLIELVAVGCVGAFLWYCGASRASLAAPPLFGALILVVAAGRGALTGLLSARWPVTVGHWSYALYISHFLFAQRLIRPILRRGLPATWPFHAAIGDVIALGCIPVLVAIAGLLTNLIQHPARSALEAMARRFRGDGPRRAVRLDIPAT